MRRAEPSTDLETRLRDLSDAGLEPGRDLWPGVEEAIHGHRRRSRRRWLAVAATLVVALGALWLRSGMLFEAPSPRTLPAASSPALAEAFEGYERSRLELLRVLTRELDSYPPEISRAIEADLAVIDAAIDSLEAALVDAPRAEDLELDLAALYRRELRVLRDLGERLEGTDVAL